MHNHACEFESVGDPHLQTIALYEGNRWRRAGCGAPPRRGKAGPSVDVRTFVEGHGVGADFLTNLLRVLCETEGSQSVDRHHLNASALGVTMLTRTDLPHTLFG